MSGETGFLAGLSLMFVLGLRHGLDPDHIACIDGLTWRSLAQSHRHAAWVGTLFAVGHGLVVTGIAFIVSRLALHLEFPALAVQVFGWVPTALLLYVGTLNLRLLRSNGDAYAPTGWKMAFVPRVLRTHSSAWAVVATGVLFATVFDTATQAAAWGYVASHHGGSGAALAAGLAFTAGMVITDTLDGRLVCHVSRGAAGPATARCARRLLGWLIVAMSYAVAAYNIFVGIHPQAELDDVAFSWAGFALVATMLALWGRLVLVRRRSGAAGAPAP